MVSLHSSLGPNPPAFSTDPATARATSRTLSANPSLIQGEVALFQLKNFLFEEGQVLHRSNFQDIADQYRISLSNILQAISGGETAIIAGMNPVKSGQKVIVRRGLAIKGVGLPTGETATAWTQLRNDFELDEFALHGTLPPNVNERTDLLVAWGFFQNDPPENIRKILLDDAGIPILDENGEPQIITERRVFTQTSSAFVAWLEPDSNGDYPLNEWGIPIGRIRVFRTGPSSYDFEVEPITYKPVFTWQHRSSEDLDHPHGSIKHYHLDPNIIGENYIPGNELTLHEMTKEIRDARGSQPTLDGRVGQSIAPDGAIVPEQVSGPIESIGTKILQGVVDEKGNLSGNAVLATGAASKVAAVSGMTNGGSPAGGFGILPLPEGYREDQCHFMVSIASLTYPVAQGSTVKLECSRQGRRVVCSAQVTDSEGAVATYYGTVNYLVVGVQNRQTAV